MTRRARHLLEMRTALERCCSLAEARLRLADLRQRARAEVHAETGRVLDDVRRDRAEATADAYRRTHFGYEQ